MADQTEPLDQPDEHAMELAVPFVVCQSQGGPYDDDAFVAGFQCGQIDQALLTATSIGNMTMRLPMVRTEVVRQAELHAMNRGYPYVRFEPDEEYPEWGELTISCEPIEEPS